MLLVMKCLCGSNDNDALLCDFGIALFCSPRPDHGVPKSIPSRRLCNTAVQCQTSDMPKCQTPETWCEHLSPLFSVTCNRHRQECQQRHRVTAVCYPLTRLIRLGYCCRRPIASLTRR